MTGPHLVRKYIEPAASPADAWISGYGVDIWALIAYLRVVDGDIDQVAKAYDLPREAVEAALAYYSQHEKVIDARLMLATTGPRG
jgi:uncharacterized protein (DUF433 family)